MKAMPKIERYMTPAPHTIGKDIPLQTALNMMREHRIRHLPVQEAGHLVGVLTDRDIKLSASFSRSTALKVEDVMTPDPYAVPADASLDDVVFQMAEHKYGCAIVTAKDKVVGIFTATDGLQVLGEVLKTSYKKGI